METIKNIRFVIDTNVMYGILSLTRQLCAYVIGVTGPHWGLEDVKIVQHFHREFPEENPFEHLVRFRPEKGNGEGFGEWCQVEYTPGFTLGHAGRMVPVEPEKKNTLPVQESAGIFLSRIPTQKEIGRLKERAIKYVPLKREIFRAAAGHPMKELNVTGFRLVYDIAHSEDV